MLTQRSLVFVLLLISSYVLLASAGGSRYIIENVYTSNIIDANTGSLGTSRQFDSRHPRPFLWSNQSIAVNHIWDIQPTSVVGYYTIRSVFADLCLDGNVNEGDAPNYSTAYKVPFLWQCTPSAFNHQWYFEAVDPANPGIYNHASGLSLDGNQDSYIPEYDRTHPNPFLYNTNDPSALNKHWRLVAPPVQFQ